MNAKCTQCGKPGIELVDGGERGSMSDYLFHVNRQLACHACVDAVIAGKQPPSPETKKEINTEEEDTDEKNN